MSQGIPDATRMHILETKINDPGLNNRMYNVKQDLEKTHTNLTWPIFYEAMLHISNDFQSVADLHHAFLQRHQHPNETPVEYFDVLLKLQTQHNITSAADQLTIFHINTQLK